MALTPEQRAIVLERLEAGESLRKASQDAGVKSHVRVLDQCAADATFADQYARARAVGYEVLADELIEIADSRSPRRVVKSNGDEIDEEDPAAVQRARLQVDTRKWMLSKMLPKVYGERLNVEHSGAVQNALSTDELMRIAAQAATPVERMRLEMLDNSVSDAAQKPDSGD
jgi:hypothetical protein